MLRKFVSIKNVGRFANYGAGGDVELKRYTLIFAENGRGKTTLCALLRSLESGNGAYLIGRSTLGAANPPEAEILTDAGIIRFGRGTWSNTVSNIAIFDSTFVAENVYSGDVVSIGQRRGLYSVIVGKTGVELAQEIAILDGKSRAKAAEINEKAAAVQAFAPRGTPVDAFVALEVDTTVADKIQAKQKELASVKEAGQIAAREGLSRLTPPSFDRLTVEELLSRTLQGIAADAERRVAAQVKRHAMHERGQTWLFEGLQYIADNSCPFCDQPLVASADLISAYRSFFSAEYNALRDQIANTRRHFVNNLSDRTIAEFQRVLDRNAASVDFWARFCEMVVPTLTGGDVGESLRALRDAALTLLARKNMALLERVNVDVAFLDSCAAFVRLQEAVVGYNKAVDAANTIIAAKKRATGTADIKTVEAALARLDAVKARFEPEARQACEEYSLAKLEKNAVEENKAAIRKQLDSYTEGVIGQYQDSINSLLDAFNAGFRITEMKHGYPGGAAASSYQILINNVAVELGDADTPLEDPSFGNTLSSGDKSALALAFFLSQLNHDPDRTSKIVVLDDPFNSQDAFRQGFTAQAIRRCGHECAQVIVLSHELRFLKRVWDRLEEHADQRKCLKLARVGEYDTKICDLDINEATQARFKADLKVLTEYSQRGTGEPRNVVQKIRPVLESHCKYLSPDLFLEKDRLGDIIAKIRSAGPNDQLFRRSDDLDELNEYTKRYHHGEGLHPTTEPINDAELQGYVRRTLEFTGGH